MNRVYEGIFPTASPGQKGQTIEVRDIVDLKSTQDKIQQHISRLAELNSKFHRKQEESFLVTFAQVMDRMADELLIARKKYEEINYQIKRDQICCILEDQVVVYKKEILDLTKQVTKMKAELTFVRQKNQELVSTVQALKNTLRNRSMTPSRNQASKSYSASKSNVDERQQLSARISLPQTKFSLRKTFFKAENNMQESFYKRIRESSIRKTQPIRCPRQQNPSCGPLRNQIRHLWSDFIHQYPTQISSIKSKQKDRIIELFMSSPKTKQLVRSIVFDSDCNE